MHTEEVNQEQLKEYVTENVIKKVIHDNNLENMFTDTKILVNPT
jgi:S-adenosylmethionine synthetase